MIKGAGETFNCLALGGGGSLSTESLIAGPDAEPFVCLGFDTISAPARQAPMSQVHLVRPSRICSGTSSRLSARS